jgi:hypothetical protein
MASLREIVNTLLPGAEQLTAAPEEALAQTVTWVRVMRARIPAFDGMDAGDLALIPLATLMTSATDAPARRDPCCAMVNQVLNQLTSRNRGHSPHRIRRELE